MVRRYKTVNFILSCILDFAVHVRWLLCNTCLESIGREVQNYVTVCKRCADRRLLFLLMTCSNLLKDCCLARKYEHAFLALAKARLSANCPRKIFMHDEETCMNARVTPKATKSRRRTADDPSRYKISDKNSGQAKHKRS